MSADPRSRAQRRRDTEHRLTHDVDVWVASASADGAPYLVLNFCLVWKKHTTLPSLAYAGMPYQVFGVRAGALALMTAWSRSPMVRSSSGI